MRLTGTRQAHGTEEAHGHDEAWRPDVLVVVDRTARIGAASSCREQENDHTAHPTTAVPNAVDVPSGKGRGTSAKTRI